MDGKLLLRLQRLETGRRFFHIGIHKTTNALVDRVHQRLREILLNLNAGFQSAECTGAVNCFCQHMLNPFYIFSYREGGGRDVNLGEVEAKHKRWIGNELADIECRCLVAISWVDRLVRRENHLVSVDRHRKAHSAGDVVNDGFQVVGAVDHAVDRAERSINYRLVDDDGEDVACRKAAVVHHEIERRNIQSTESDRPEEEVLLVSFVIERVGRR